jgi:hypothetical protein
MTYHLFSIHKEVIPGRGFNAFIEGTNHGGGRDIGNCTGCKGFIFTNLKQFCKRPTRIAAFMTHFGKIYSATIPDLELLRKT